MLFDKEIELCSFLHVFRTATTKGGAHTGNPTVVPILIQNGRLHHYTHYTKGDGPLITRAHQHVCVCPDNYLAEFLFDM